MKYDHSLLNVIVSRVKIISGLDISERRSPQDGRATAVVDGREFDIRVSTLPTVYGEKVVMRLNEKTTMQLEKSRLGISGKEMQDFDKMLGHPHGIILVTGPTGSGKSTTLYTALSELNVEGVNIITVEDPVEVNIAGVNQVQVNEKAGLSFVSALRSILRQDPDIIMIGEIRDAETAAIAVQAAITGHLVVSTLHTNSTAATIDRLVDMGVEPYLVADSLVGIIAQRLARRLCVHCKEAYEATDAEKRELGLDVSQPYTLYRHKGCGKCDGTGYFGRIGIFETMDMSPELRNLVASKAPTAQVRKVSIEQGTHTLLYGYKKLVREGVTSMFELHRAEYSEE
jgi:type IV pilus assembly protein PilB